MELVQKLVRFESDNHMLLGWLVSSDAPNGVGILFLHGGGERTGKDTFDEWQNYLGIRGFSSFAFDFRGAPKQETNPDLKSEGDFADSTLNNRLRDAQAALRFYIDSGWVNPHKLALCGLSMGGHTAAVLAGKYPYLFKILMLKAPAAYGAAAEDKRHDGSFKAVITQPESWFDSPAFEAVKNFPGRKLLFFGAGDTVIPRDVKLRYMRAALGGGNSTALDSQFVGHLPLGSDKHHEVHFRSKLFYESAIALERLVNLDWYKARQLDNYMLSLGNMRWFELDP